MSRSTPKSSPYPWRSYNGYNIISGHHTDGLVFCTAFFLTSNSRNQLFASLKFFIFCIINQSGALLKSTWVPSPCMFPTQASSLAIFLRLGKNFQAAPSFFFPQNKAICLPSPERHLPPTSKKLCIQIHESNEKKKKISGPLLCKIPTNPYLPDLPLPFSFGRELLSSSSHFVPVRSNWISSMSTAFICSHVWNR